MNTINRQAVSPPADPMAKDIVPHNTGTTATAVTTRYTRLLNEPVGAGCPNHHDDVETLQRLLNLNGPRFGLNQRLTLDGVFGRKTIDALSAYQRTVLCSPEPSGTVQPGDTALRSLCRGIPGSFGKTVLCLIFLHADETAIQNMTPPIDATMTRYGIDTPLRQAHFLAQIGHESGELRFREELAEGTAYENRPDLGNTRPGDGPRYKGRGLIQLTGRSNYSQYCRACGVDVLERPELVATDDNLCADVAGWFWDRHKLNSHADRDDLEKITRVVNGGLNGLANRRRLLNRAGTLFGI